MSQSTRQIEWPKANRTRRRGKDRIPVDHDLAVTLIVSRLLESVADVAEYAARRFDKRDGLTSDQPGFLADDDAYHFSQTLRGIAWNCSNGATMLSCNIAGNISSDSDLLLGDLEKLNEIFDELFPDAIEDDEAEEPEEVEEDTELTAVIVEGGALCSS